MSAVLPVKLQTLGTVRPKSPCTNSLTYIPWNRSMLADSNLCRDINKCSATADVCMSSKNILGDIQTVDNLYIVLGRVRLVRRCRTRNGVSCKICSDLPSEVSESSLALSSLRVIVSPCLRWQTQRYCLRLLSSTDFNCVTRHDVVSTARKSWLN